MAWPKTTLIPIILFSDKTHQCEQIHYCESGYRN